MEFGDALIDEAHHLLGGDGGGNQVARLLIVVQALEAMAEPIRARWFPISERSPTTCLKLWIGMMPGTIGMVMPRARTRSRKRKNTSLSKKNWLIARVAPASIFCHG